MEASTAALVAATAVQPLNPVEALAAPMQHVEDSCKACHEEFTRLLTIAQNPAICAARKCARRACTSGC